MIIHTNPVQSSSVTRANTIIFPRVGTLICTIEYCRSKWQGRTSPVTVIDLGLHVVYVSEE